MIYFFEDVKLAEELRDGRTSEFQKFAYFMLLSIWALISGSSTYISLMYHPVTPMERIIDFYLFVIGITGLWTCYERNKEGDHRDFITRITCLGFPAYVRMSFLGLLLYVPMKFGSERLGWNLSDDFMMVVTNIIIWPYMYYRLYKTIGIAASVKNPSN